MMLKLKNSNFLSVKRSKRRQDQQSKDHVGCMSGFIRVFDFRHGRITSRMLSDLGRNMSENNEDPLYPISELNSLTNSKDMHPRIESRNDEKGENPSDQTDDMEKTKYRDLEDLMNEILLVHQKRNEEQKPKSIERSNSFSNERTNPRTDEPMTRKNRNLFRRRSKSHECILLNENDNNNGRIVSQFSFTEIKKRLKNVIGKDRTGCREKPVFDELFTKISNNGNTSDRISNIDVEARKHLTEMLSNGNVEVELAVGDFPKTIARILSFPEYNSPSLEYNTPDAGTSPRNETGQGVLTVINESQLFSTNDDPQEPEVSDEVHHGEGVLDTINPISPEETSLVDVSDLNEEVELSCSPVATPSTSSLSINRKNDERESTLDDRTGRPSPVSVLEPPFLDDDISPSRTVSQFVQPLCIRFEETVLTPTGDREIFIQNHVENEESEFEYIEAVLLASDLNWAEVETRWLSSAQMLDQSLFNELEIFSSRAPHDQRLLFDSTNEILKDLSDCSLGLFPDLRFVKPNAYLLSRGMKLINEVWEIIESRLNSFYSRSLDQLVKKDLDGLRLWMDMRLETREIVIEIEELIFNDVIDDIILRLMDD